MVTPRASARRSGRTSSGGGRSSGRTKRVRDEDDEEEVEEDEDEEEEEDLQDVEQDDDEEEEMPARSSRRQTYKSGRSSGGNAGGGNEGRTSKRRGKGNKAVVDDEEDDANIEVEDVTFSDDDGDNRKTQLYQALTQGNKRGRGKGGDGDDDDDPEEMDAMEQARTKMQRWKDTMDLNHAIDESTANKVMMELIKGLKSCRQNGEETIEFLSDCASALEEHNDGKVEHPRLQQLDKDVRELIDAQYHVKSRVAILERIKDEVLAGMAEGMDLEVKYSETSEGLVNAYKAKTPRQKYADSELYENFKVLAWESALWRGTDPVPTLKQMIPAEDGDEEEQDDDMEMGGVTVNYKCPLTQALLENPVKSKRCGHTYSNKAIREHMRGRSVACPVAGCPQQIQVKDLMPAPMLAKRVEVHARKLKRQEEAQAKHRSDKAEVID